MLHLGEDEKYIKYLFSKPEVKKKKQTNKQAQLENMHVFSLGSL